MGASLDVLGKLVAMDCDDRGLGADGRFVDRDFPPSAASLGTPKPGRSFLSEEQLGRCRWLRLPNILQMNGCLLEQDLQGEARLDWDSIEPNDLCQGRIGNCWLIASVAALAEFPGAVKRLFVDADVANGRYSLRLYDMSKGAWEIVEIDDYIPCTREEDWSTVPCEVDSEGKKTFKYKDIYNEQGMKKVPGKWVPLFGRAAGNKVWALLLEKAMAKFVGSYARLSGGAEPYALTAFTGFPIVYCFVRPSLDPPEDTQAALGQWQWCGAQYIGRDSPGQCYASVPNAPPALGDQEMWGKLLEYDARNYVMTASITRYAQPEDQRGYYRPDGLVLGHAYSFIAGKLAATASGETVRLVMLRNPHGESQEDGEITTCWQGDWSDGSELWERHPEVATQVGFSPMKDGIFWMSWSDFTTTFDKVCVLPRSMEEPRAARAFRRRRGVPTGVCHGLAQLGDSRMQEDLRQLSVMFDPFTSLPEFLDDGTLDTRLRWQATKPGMLQEWIDLNKTSGNRDGYRALLAKVKELGLERALGSKGFAGRATPGRAGG